MKKKKAPTTRSLKVGTSAQVFFLGTVSEGLVTPNPKEHLRPICAQADGLEKIVAEHHLGAFSSK